jgi:hypothetical protein
MDRRFAFPGKESQKRTTAAPQSVATVDVQALAAGPRADQYLDTPRADRWGICCSGGGIRSASYCLGALQVLRREEVLQRAEHMAAVSGGDYISLAHGILVNETLRAANPAPDPNDPRPKEDQFFERLAPWAAGSPEEKHLRDSTTYLAPGLLGKVWLAVNLVYGMIRHLVPFAAVITLMGTILGFGYSRWLGPSLRETLGHRPVSYLVGWLVLAGLAALAGALLMARQIVDTSSADGGILGRLQRMITRVVIAQAAAALLLLVIPAILLFFRGNPANWIHSVTVTVSSIEIGSVSLLSILAYLARRGFFRKLLPRVLPVVTALIGPLVVGIPLVAVAGWVARRANHPLWPVVVGLSALAMLAIYWFFLDETTSTAHLFYRERLATAFVGARVSKDTTDQGYEPPPWQEGIYFSEICRGTSSARLPNLIVCAAVNANKAVPPGRQSGSFSFERDFSGGPLTGYVATGVLEQLTWGAGLTMPALMAISGAAVSPSMGRMTRGSLRLLMAMLNARLGVWIHNPADPTLQPMTPAQVQKARQSGEDEPPPSRCVETAPTGGGASPQRFYTRLRDRVVRRSLRPNFAYVFREALGLNDVSGKFVYVTDGGHFDNLGLVELLRRGCGRIVCFDAAGDALGEYFVLSDAMALARSDLGVEIDINLSPLKPDENTGISPSDHAVGHHPVPRRGGGEAHLRQGGPAEGCAPGRPGLP